MNDLQQHTVLIAARVKDLTALGDLFGVPQFVQLHRDPGPWAEAARQLYLNPQVDAFQKEIAGYAMQRLPLPDFVRLVSAVADEVQALRLPSRALERLAFPQLQMGAQLALNHEQPEVQALLRRLAELPGLAQRSRNYITDEVLPGKARASILALREAGQLPPGN